MDLNDIISMQSDITTESTLESEIDALSKIITDTKDSVKKLEDDDDFKLDSDDLAFADSLQCDSLERDKCELLPNDDLAIKGIFSNTEKIKHYISTSITKTNLQQTSIETLNLTDDKQNNKDRNNELQEQIEDSEPFVISSENIVQTGKIDTVLETAFCKVNNSLTLISESYNSQEFQSCSESQPLSLSEIEELTRSENTTNININENLNNETKVLKNIDSIEIKTGSFDLSSGISKKVEKSMIQTLTTQNNENKSCNQIDIVQKKFSKKTDFNIEPIHLNDTEDKNCALDINYQSEENTNKMVLQIDDLNKREKSNIQQKEISNIIKLHLVEKTDNIIKKFKIEENKTAVTNKIDEIQQLSRKCKQNIIENEIDNTEKIFHQTKTELVESNTSILELKDALKTDKRELLNMIKNVGNSKLSEDNFNFEISAVENIISDKITTKSKSSLVITNDDKQNIVQSEKLEEIEKQKSIDIAESTDINQVVVKETKVYEEIETSNDIEINVKNKKNEPESLIEEKKIENLQDINLNSNVQLSIQMGKKTNIKILQNTNIDIVSLQNAETIKNIKHLKHDNIDVSVESPQEIEKNVLDFIQKVKTINIHKHSQNSDILENSEEVIDSELLEQKIIDSNEVTNKIDNIETIQNIITNISSHCLKNADKNLENIKVIKKNDKNKTVISTTEVSLVNENKNLSKIDTLPKELLIIKNKQNVENKICKSNEKNKTIKIQDNLFINAQNEISNKHIQESTIKDLLELKNINQAVDASKNDKLKEVDNEPIYQSFIKINKKLEKNLISVQDESFKDLNTKLELKKENLKENKRMQESDIKEETSVNENVQDDLIQKKKEDNGNQTNLSEYKLASQCISDEQIELSSPVSKLIINENSDVAKVSDMSETEESDLTEILNINQKMDEITKSDQGSLSQELIPCILNRVEKDLSSNLDKLLKTEKNTSNQAVDFINLKNSSLPIEDIQSPNEKLQDSLSVFDLQTESISNKQENQNKGFDPTEKNEDIILMFDKSSQSSREIQNNKFINDLYNNCTTDDIIEKNHDTFKNRKKFNDLIFNTEQNNKNNIEKQEKLNININSNISEKIDGNVQFKALEDVSKISIENQVVIDKSLEISELESAVKYLQESEKQEIETLKIVKDVINEENSSVFVSVEDSICDNVSELASDFQEVTDPIAISEAEIISEAAKLESERKEKLELEQQFKSSIKKSCDVESIHIIKVNDISDSENLSDIGSKKELNILSEILNTNTLKTTATTKNKLTMESLPTVSILEEYCKNSPKIDISDISSKISDLPNSSKTSLFIHKDTKQILESPDRAIKNLELKTSDNSKKDFDKQQQQQFSESENVGSPRIILKIAKSAITECSEPRSPKSPKIRSAANSPNPEDNSGQKLGKIKLKLSKGGHPSIIPNTDNYDETVQWHTDSTSSLSPLGMKIKLTKTAENLMLDNKYEEDQKQDELKEKALYKLEEARKTEASIGMKIKFSKSGDASIVHQDNNAKDSIIQEISTIKKQDSPLIGMKIKLSKFGEAAIIPQDKTQSIEEMISKSKDKTIEDIQESVKRTESSIGMKIKLSKSGDASVITNESPESIKEGLELRDKIDRTDSPIGVKIKLAKMKDGGASIISDENTDETKDKFEISDILKKIKLSKKREAETIETNEKEENESLKQQESSKTKISKIIISENDTGLLLNPLDETSKVGIGMKIKLSKSGDALIVNTKNEDSQIEVINKANEQPIGVKIKLSKTGDPSIIYSETLKEDEDLSHGDKTKHLKNKDSGFSTIGQQKYKDDSHLEMKIKLSKTGHPIIITNEIQEDPLNITNISLAQSHKNKDHKDLLIFKESTIKALKKSHSDVSIEPIKGQSIENSMIDLHNKRKEITIAPIELKKLKMEANLKQILPDVTIQPIVSGMKKELSQQKLLLESNSGNISRQQMNVINQEISITQIHSLTVGDTLINERLKNAISIQNEPLVSSPLNSDCEIIEPQPELIIVNENSNSSQDIMIIDEVPPKSTTKLPKKRGRPRRNTTTINTDVTDISSFQEMEFQKDPLSLEQTASPIIMPISMSLSIPLSMSVPILQHQMQPQIGTGNTEGIERPRRTCRSQKSYAPPKRGRGRGRGKRKNESMDIPLKKQRIEQDLTNIENVTTTVIALEKFSVKAKNNMNNSSELFKALNQPTLERTSKQMNEVDMLKISECVQTLSTCEQKSSENVQEIMKDIMEITSVNTEITHNMETNTSTIERIPSKNLEKSTNKAKVIVVKMPDENEKHSEATSEQREFTDHKDSISIQEHQNWLAPTIKKIPNDSTARNESVSTLTVIDEETRMSAESSSRSQTPARTVVIPGTSETLINEESQGSVLSTATTESEKVKVRNRRMEISFDPDEGPFTVEKIAEYEWPLEKKDDKPAGRGETFMIQEQISQYLGVKSFKRKYPDLKRRMVDMEERNFLRENGLVSESMCDMGLTAVSSSEVLDIMCSDFPEQYEEYRKHMREKAAKEHSKKQKELSAAANAERNRIDLAEMAMQSALSWNSCLNKARQDSRKCSLDLQTFTVHMPKRPIKLDLTKKVNHYPVALIPGQYTDYYREYTPAELRYYPLNTVLYGPMLPNERKFDSQSEGSQSDSDSDSSSDDSSSTSSEGTQDTEGSQSTMGEIDMEMSLQPDIKCKMCLNNLNKNNRPEVLIQCGTCTGNVHPSCIDLTLDMVPHIRAYAWQCTDCKTCAQCHDPADEDKMLFCDMCDRGYHIYCVGLRRVPQGRWHCQECAICANCGSKEPGGINSDRNSVAQWQHEYKKGDKNTRVYVSTFCIPCSKLWRKGRYCPHCSRCHNAPRLDLETNLVHCGACDKYLHLDCVETMEQIIDKKRYYCEFCSPDRQQFAKPLISKIFKT